MAFRATTKICGVEVTIVELENPGVGGVSDRAWRYRAQRNAPPRCPCYWCGRDKNPAGRPLEVAHIDGHEEHVERENLGWTCRPCNVLVGQVLKHAGIGRLTEQFNPGESAGDGGATSFRSWTYAVLVMRGEIPATRDELAEVVQVVKKTNPSKRAKFAKLDHSCFRAQQHAQLRSRRNPPKRSTGSDTGARTLAQWAYAATVMRGDVVDDNMSPQQAYELMMDTPAFWRKDYNRQLWKRRKARRA